MIIFTLAICSQHASLAHIWIVPEFRVAGLRAIRAKLLPEILAIMTEVKTLGKANKFVSCEIFDYEKRIEFDLPVYSGSASENI